MSSNSAEPVASWNQRAGIDFCRCARPAWTSARKAMSTPASSAATCRRLRTTPMSKILCETDAGELPALVGVEEIAIGGTQMPARGGAAAAAQDELPAHELAIIFADRARRGAEAGR